MTDDATQARTTRAGRLFLLILVILSGGVVLSLEVLGTRVIGTHYGSSLYVWAALLSVTLVCLAIGYAIGGRLADRVPRTWMLCLLLMLAGGSVMLVPFLTRVLVPLGDRLGLAWGAIGSALIIFFLPLTLAATAGPYVIRLCARKVEGVGSTSGTVYALSTIGSVGGVLIVSLWLIPSLGTSRSLLVCSATLIGLGALGMTLSLRGRAAPLLLLALLPAVLGGKEPAFPGELFHTESPYGDLRVIQRDEPGRGVFRMLMVNGIMQTGMPMDIDLVSAGDILRSDQYYLELLPYFHADLASDRKVLLIGLAGGMFARVMEFYEVDVTAVEIDVKVAELAKAYFGYRGEIFFPSGKRHDMDLSRFPNRANPMLEALARTDPEHLDAHVPREPYRGRAVIQDGRQYLLSHTEPMDFIVLDAYNADMIPFHLITREFFELVRDRLTDDGILAINYIGRPQDDFVTDSLFRTLREVFGAERMQAYRTRADPAAVQVMTVFAFRRPMTLMTFLLDRGPASGVGQLSYELHLREVNTNRPGGTIITDDLNPVDLARASVALEWRRETGELIR